MTLPVKTEVAAMFGAGPFDRPGDFYLDVPAGHASTPDAASLDITGDIHIRAEINLADWTPGANRYIVEKWNSTGNQRSYSFGLATTGKLFVETTVDGTLATAVTHFSTVSLSATVGRLAVGVKFVTNDGGGNRKATFEVSDHIGGSWFDISTETVAGTTTIFSSSSVLEVGNVNDGTFRPLGGRIYAAQVRDGIGGTLVANPDFTVQARGTTSFADSTGKTWTISGGASLVGFNWAVLPTDRPKSLAWSAGRDNELVWFTATNGTVVLRNNDRRYDPDYTSGPHFGDLLPRVPVRFRLSSDNGATWMDAYYGFVSDGWAQAYAKPFVSTATVQLADMLDVLDGEPLPLTAYDGSVLGSHPVAYWKFDESAGTVMADFSGNGNNGAYDNGEAVDPLVYGGVHGFSAPHVGDNRGRFSGGTLPQGPPCTLEAWVQITRDLAASHSIIVIQRDHALGSGVSLAVATSAGGSPNGELTINFFGIGTFYNARGSTRIDDGMVHHVVCTIGGLTAADVHLWVDGVQETKTTISGTDPGAWTSHLLWTVANTVDTGAGDFGLGGVIDEVAVYDRVLDDDEIVDHYGAGTTAFAGETSGARVNRILDIVGVPSDLRDIATGDTTSGPFTPAGDSAGAALAKVVESEQGALYVAHHDGGKVKFRGRYARLTETRSTTSQATFSDDPNTLRPFREDIVPDPATVKTLVNVVEVTWQGGQETVEDAPSRARYGPQSRNLTTDAPSPVAARSAGYWMMARYSQPQSRIRRLPLGPGGAKPQVTSSALAMQVSDRVTVERRPQNVGAVTSQPLIVEGYEHTLDHDQSWLMTVHTSDANTSTVWIWGTSAWGVDAAWG